MHCMVVHKTKVTRPRPRRYIFKTKTRPRRSTFKTETRRDVPKNVSRPSRDRDVQDRDYIPDCYSVSLQLSAKKRYVYGAIAIIWIVIPSLETTFTALITDIVKGTCVRFPINNSYAVMKTIAFLLVFNSFFLPLTLMVFCYTRIVLALQSEVIVS